MTEQFTSKSCLKRSSINVSVREIAQIILKIKHKIIILFKSQFTNYSSEFNVLILPNISSYQPDRLIDISSWDLPGNIKLAEQNFNDPQDVDMLIEASKFLKLFSVGLIKLENNHPTFQKTLLGWIVSSEFSTVVNNFSNCFVFSQHFEMINENSENFDQSNDRIE
jgi:hypothetical protein